MLKKIDFKIFETDEVLLTTKPWLTNHIMGFTTLVYKETALVVKIRTAVMTVVLYKIIKRMT